MYGLMPTPEKTKLLFVLRSIASYQHRFQLRKDRNFGIKVTVFFDGIRPLWDFRNAPCIWNMTLRCEPPGSVK